MTDTAAPVRSERRAVALQPQFAARQPKQEFALHLNYVFTTVCGLTVYAFGTGLLTGHGYREHRSQDGRNAFKAVGTYTLGRAREATVEWTGSVWKLVGIERADAKETVTE